ncbi:hypothetical protein [Aquipseudomonas campi]
MATLSIDGDLPQATRKRTGADASFTAPAVPGNPQRAASMQAQAVQPVTKGGGPLVANVTQLEERRADRPRTDIGVGDMVAGALSVPVAAARDFSNNIGTDISNVGRSAIGGQQVPRPGYPRTTAALERTQAGASRFVDANANLLSKGQGIARELTGVTPAPQAAVQADKLDANPLVSPTIPAAKSPEQESPQYTHTGVSGVAMNIADGVPSFTNDQQAYQSAQAMPAGGKGSIGDGVGTFSQMEPGTSQLALDRFERANQERGKMVQVAHASELGNNGGRLTVVRDSSRTPTLQERQLSRQEARLAETDALRMQTQQGLLAGLDQRQTNQLQRQRTQQELSIGDISLTERQRLEGLAAQIADPSLSADQRETARNSYTSLSTPAKDRFKSQDVILGRDENGRDIRGTQLIDVTTGKPVTGIGEGVFGLPQGVSKDQALSEATAAIASGISKDAVNRRLREWGIDPV